MADKDDKLLLYDEAAFSGGGHLGSLRRRLEEVTGICDLGLERQGEAAVELTLPAHHVDDQDRIRGLIDRDVDGWHVIDRSSYGLPSAL